MNTCRSSRYLNLRLIWAMMPPSRGCTRLMVFGERKSTSILLNVGRTLAKLYAKQFSIHKRTFPFCIRRIYFFKHSSHVRNRVCIIQALELRWQSDPELLAELSPKWTWALRYLHFMSGKSSQILELQHASSKRWVLYVLWPEGGVLDEDYLGSYQKKGRIHQGSIYHTSWILLFLT